VPAAGVPVTMQPCVTPVPPRQRWYYNAYGNYEVAKATGNNGNGNGNNGNNGNGNGNNGNGNGNGNCSPRPAETGTAYVDGVVLEVSYLPPGFEQHRCTTGASSCEIVHKGKNATSFIRGTVYAPTAAIFADVRNDNLTVFGRGVIARTIAADASVSSKQRNAAFQVPGASGQRVVLFEARVGGKPRLRAKVRYTDVKDGTGLPGAQVNVLSWVVLR
jgi:hypothetical protein